MADVPRKPNLGQALQLVQLVSMLANFNWKGLKNMWAYIKNMAKSVNLQDYWGRLILVIIAGALIGFILFDWRQKAVEAVEAKADLAVAVAERDTLALKVRADEAARLERTLILTELAKMDETEIKQLQEALDANPDWANQPIPTDVLRSLRP